LDVEKRALKKESEGVGTIAVPELFFWDLTSGFSESNGCFSVPAVR
jgi:hypothetical protein